MMKTLEKVRVLLFLGFCVLAFLFFARPELDKAAPREQHVEAPEGGQRRQALDFDRMKWDRLLTFQDGHYQIESNIGNPEEEVDLVTDQQAELEKDDSHLMEVRVDVQQRIGADNQLFDGEDTQVKLIPEENYNKPSVMFTPSGRKYVIKDEPMPLFPVDQCPPGFVAEGSNPVFDTLARCQHQATAPADVEQWYYSQVTQCGGQIAIFNREMALLQDVILDKNHCDALANEFGVRKYGTDFTEGQYHFELGFFKIYCPTNFNLLSYAFRGGEANYLSRWYYVTEGFSNTMTVDFVVTQVTIAVTRYKPDNLYHTLAEIYNAYLAMRFLNVPEDHILILMVDTYPYNSMMSLWGRSFPFTLSLSQINTRTHFHTMVWNVIGEQSHFHLTDLPTVGYIDDFRDYILRRFDLINRKPLNCNSLTILIVLRRDYVDNEGKVIKKIGRTIDNEQQLWLDLSANFKTDQVNGSQFDLLPLKSQLSQVNTADILIGMHGAGLAHALFLPSHAAVLELFPGYWRELTDQYKAICRWRGLHYDSWTNTNPEQESPEKDKVVVDTAAIVQKVVNIKSRMCPFASLRRQGKQD